MNKDKEKTQLKSKEELKTYVSSGELDYMLRAIVEDLRTLELKIETLLEQKNKSN